MFPYYLAVTILCPLLFALFFRVNGNSRLRRSAVFFVGGVFLLCAGWPVAIGAASYRPGGVISQLLYYLFVGGNVAAVLGIGYAAWRWRDRLLGVVGLVQTALLAWSLYVPGVNNVAGGFVLDHLSGLLLLLINSVGAMLLLFAAEGREQGGRRRAGGNRRLPQLWATVLLLGAMQGVVLSDRLFWVCLFLQVAAFSATGLIADGGSKQALHRARYFLRFVSLANAAVLAGIVLLPDAARALSFAEMLLVPDAAALLPALACWVTAGMIFSGQLPFQSIFLRALAEPFSASALLQSCTMAVAGSYLFLRFSPLFINTWLGNVAAVAGAFSFMGAALLAVLQRRQDRVLAYSSTSCMGLILALACFPQLPAIYTALLLVVWHGFSKALLLAGLDETSAGPLGRLHLLGAVSLMLPPFGAPLAQSVALEASGRNPVAMALLIAGMAFSLAAWGRYILAEFFSPSNAVSPVHSSRQKLVAQVGLALGLLASSLVGIPMANHFGAATLQENFSRFDDIAQGGASGFLIRELAGIDPLAAFAVLAVLFGVGWTAVKMLTVNEPAAASGPLAESENETSGTTDLAASADVPPAEAGETTTPADSTAVIANELAEQAEKGTEPVNEAIPQPEPETGPPAEPLPTDSIQIITEPPATVPEKAAGITWGTIFHRIADERRIERYATVLAAALIILMFEVIIR